MNPNPSPATAHDTAVPEASRSLLRMAVADEVLAVSIEDVREILQVGRLTPLPRTPSFVRGVMNLRGAVVPVIDLAARLGGAATVIGRRSCIVVVEHEAPQAVGQDDEDLPVGLVVGLLVDAVFEVFDTGPSGIEPAPAIGTRVAPELLQGITRARDTLIGVLALERVLSPHELAQSIASFQPH